MAPLDPNKTLTGDLADNRCNQRIRFFNAVVSKVFDAAREFAIDKEWRNYFLARNKLCICQLIQNSFQFELLSKISKALISKLEKFSESDSANPRLIIVFDKATNLFTPIFGTADLDTSCYVALNCVLSYLKKLFAWFFIIFTESRVEKLLLLDILAKEAEKRKRDVWSKTSSHMSLSSTSNPTDNLKWLRLFPLFVLFWFDVEEKRRMLALELRGKELSKPIAIFSKYKHTSIFGKPL